MRPANFWFGARPFRAARFTFPYAAMDDIFDRLAAMRAAAEARAQRIYERTLALETRRRELYVRMDAIRHLTISPAADVAEDRDDGPVDAVSTAA